MSDRFTRPLLLVLLASGIAAPALAARPVSPKATPVKPVEAVEIDLSHMLGTDKNAQLQKLVERFNATHPGGKIVVREQHWSQGAQPMLSIVNEADEENFLNGPARFKPVWQVMRDSKEALATLPANRVMVPAALDERQRLQALPVALSTPVMFYNRQALEAVGIAAADIPKTWDGWQDVLGKLYAAGNACPLTVSQPVSTLLENASAWNNQAFVTGGKSEQIAVNGLIQVKHLAKMSSWYKARYLHYFGRSSEGELRFSNGECAVLAAPSAAWPSLQRESAFPVGVSTYPYHEDAYGAPQNTWADGPALWVAGGRSAAEYKLAARFIRFWLSAESQVEWQVNAGYLPLSAAGFLATTTSKLLRDELAAQRVAIAQLTYKPVTANSYASAFGHRRGVRRVLAEEMEAVFADKKPPKQGLDDAVQRIRAGEQGCCRPLAGMPAGRSN